MIYLLDTNTCIQYINQRNSAILNTLQTKRREDVAAILLNLSCIMGLIKVNVQSEI
jgi:predicted nucleic acid-binding protein